MKKKILVIIVSTVFLIDCRNNTESKSTVDSISMVGLDLKKADAKADSLNTNATFEQLQGMWQSVEDEKSFVSFEGDQRRGFVEGMVDVEGEKFILSGKCMNESDKNSETEKGMSLYISCVESNMCWYVVNVDSEALTLSYMARGNTLEYKRVKTNSEQ